MHFFNICSKTGFLLSPTLISTPSSSTPPILRVFMAPLASTDASWHLPELMNHPFPYDPCFHILAGKKQPSSLQATASAQRQRLDVAISGTTVVRRNRNSRVGYCSCSWRGSHIPQRLSLPHVLRSCWPQLRPCSSVHLPLFHHTDISIKKIAFSLDYISLGT